MARRRLIDEVYVQSGRRTQCVTSLKKKKKKDVKLYFRISARLQKCHYLTKLGLFFHSLFDP